MHRAGDREIGDGLKRNSDGEVIAAIAIEVPGGQRRCELIVLLGLIFHAGDILVQELAPLSLQPARRTEEDVDSAGELDAIHCLIGRADGEIIEPIAVEVAGREGSAELVIPVGVGRHAGRTLGEELILRGAKPDG